MHLTAIYFVFWSVASTLAATLPGAPSIVGVVTDGSQIIQVAHLLPDVIEVVIKDVETGVIIAKGRPSSLRHGKGLVTVTMVSNLVASHHLTATQRNPSGTSPESPPNDMQIKKFHNPRPPTITSSLHTCMTAIQVGDVVVGAKIKVSTRFPPVVIGETTATDTDQIWVDLDPGVILAMDEVLSVSQELEGPGGTYKGETLTDPLKSYDVFMGVSDRNIYTDPNHPLTACQMEIDLSGGIPGVQYSLDNEGVGGTFDYGSFSYRLGLFQPLKEGKLVITSPGFPDQCGKAPPKSKTFPVGPAEPPGVPVNKQAPCGDSHSLVFEGLVDDGTLTVIHDDGIGDVDVRNWGNGAGPFPLPTSWDLANGRTTFFQTDVCGTPSDTGKVALQLQPLIQTPKFLGDLYECSTFIAFTGTLESRTTVFQNNPLLQLSTPSPAEAVVVDGSEALAVHIPILWEKLYRGEEIFLRQEDCGSTRETPTRPVVKGLPGKLETLFFDPPTAGIFTTSDTVTITGALPGAVIHVFADGTPIGQANAYSTRVTVPIGGPHFPHFPFTLEDGQSITAIQTFHCDPPSVVSSEPQDPKNEQNPPIKVTGPPFEGIVREPPVTEQKVLKEL